MFGFLQAPHSSYCGRAPHLWRSYFCGLATRMHQDFGPWSRFLINRDSTFLALAGSLTAPASTRLTTCCNPLATPKPISDSGPAIEYAADITLCALGIKLRDDVNDEGWARRLLAKAGSKSVQPAVDKAVARLNSNGFPTDEVATTILSQDALESTRPHAIEAAQPTADAYGRIFEQMPGTNSSLWSETGRSLGRLIYWDDAWLDWSKDLKHKRFNPLSQTQAPELRELMDDEFTNFQSKLASLAASPITSILQQVATQTRSRIPMVGETPAETEKKRRKRKKQRRDNKKNSCWDNCCDCAGNIDCCDCGDTSGCCPCDGCGGCDCS